MLHILPAYLVIFGAGAKVVVLFRQPDAALIYVCDFSRGVFQILFHTETEEGLHTDALQVRDLRGHFVAGLNCCDAIQFRLYCRDASLLNASRIHAACIVVAYLLLVAAGRGMRRRSLLQNAVQRLQVELVDIAELVVRGQICGNGMQFAVVAAGVLVKVRRMDRRW